MTEERYRPYLWRRYRVILGYTGLIGILVGGIVLSPLLLLPVYSEELPYAWCFLLPGLGLVLVGLALWHFLLPRSGESLSFAEGAAVVVFSWVLAVLAGALACMTSGGLTFTQGVFEATSGWTTTGLSVIDVSRAPHLLLFYRSVSQFAGGAGLAIIMLSALAGPAGTGLSTAEGRADQLVPNVRQSARLVVTIYSGYTIFGCLALRWAGMDWFDAVNHAFTSLSTGGFSTRVESIGYWDSPRIEGVVMVLMLLGTMNFVTAYVLWHGKFRAVGKNGELRLQALVLPLVVIILFSGVTAGLYPTFGKQLRVALFEAVSALSTTGFSTVNYNNWNSLGWLVLIVLMIVGGGTGSTAGGLKQYRVYALYHGLLWELRRMWLPANAVTEADIWVGENRRFLSDRDLGQIGVFVALYLASLLLGAGVLCSYGYPLKEGLFEFASALGTVGLSVGVTTTGAPTGLLWVEIVGMIFGRLEFFVIILGSAHISSSFLASVVRS